MLKLLRRTACPGEGRELAPAFLPEMQFHACSMTCSAMMPRQQRVPVAAIAVMCFHGPKTKVRLPASPPQQTSSTVQQSGCWFFYNKYSPQTSADTHGLAAPPADAARAGARGGRYMPGHAPARRTYHRPACSPSPQASRSPAHSSPPPRRRQCRARRRPCRRPPRRPPAARPLRARPPPAPRARPPPAPRSPALPGHAVHTPAGSRTQAWPPQHRRVRWQRGCHHCLTSTVRSARNQTVKCRRGGGSRWGPRTLPVSCSTKRPMSGAGPACSL